MILGLSTLRLLGIALGGLGLILLLWRRRQAELLGRLEVAGWMASILVLAIGIVPGLADALPGLTGFTGPLARITSVLAFAVLGMGAWVLFLQLQLGETRLRFLTLLKRMAVDSGVESWQGPRPGIVLIMPALNEAENLAEVLPGAPKDYGGQSILVVLVDDGSEDETAAVARRHGALVLKTPINVGGGHALQVGFLAAKRLGATIVVTMDADGQHRFADLPQLLDPILKDQADMVIGSRHLGESVGHEAVRALGLRLFNLLISFLTGRTITDCSSGYRAFRLAPLLKLPLVQDRHHTAETILLAARAGLRLIEAPITILPRYSGESKKGTNWRYGLRFARTVLVSWWRGTGM
ncbi:MAG TPA: glycosyltransferase family 2 protein [Myxococcota bacterium]|nr:glycosyltransferase family 2 protein [Myxococcota bacterium]